MKKFPIWVGVITLLTLSACDFEIKEKNEIPKDNIRSERIFDRKLIDQKTYVANVKAGDRVRIRIEGQEFAPQFRKLVKKGRSTWKKKVCHRIPDDPCRFPHACYVTAKEQAFPLGSYCEWKKKKGTCRGFYREKVDPSEKEMVLEPKLANNRMKIKIGDNTYPLGEVVSYQVTSMETVFHVSREMIRESDELSLVVSPDPDAKKIKTGFLGYKSCQGRGKKGFNSNLDRSSRKTSTGSKVEYTVSLAIEYEVDK